MFVHLIICMCVDPYTSVCGGLGKDANEKNFLLCIGALVVHIRSYATHGLYFNVIYLGMNYTC